MHNDALDVGSRYVPIPIARITSATSACGVSNTSDGRPAEWQRVLHRQTPLSGQVVLRLLEGNKIAWTPRKNEGLYEFRGRAALDRLLTGLVVTRGMASPMPASWNHIVKWLGLVDGLREAAWRPKRGQFTWTKDPVAP